MKALIAVEALPGGKNLQHNWPLISGGTQ